MPPPPEHGDFDTAPLCNDGELNGHYGYLIVESCLFLVVLTKLLPEFVGGSNEGVSVKSALVNYL